MTPWLYLVLAFALLFTLQRGQGRPASGVAFWVFYFRLTAALAGVVVIQNICSLFAWEPSGREDWGRATLFLWALLIDWAVNGAKKKDQGRGGLRFVISPFSLALFSFSYWTTEGNFETSRFLGGLLLPVAAGFLEWLLAGLWGRVRLSEVPPRIEGVPILFWLAMLLALGICKLG